jgi:hypothetical protein
MFVTSNLKAVLALGLAIIGSSAHADEIVEGPLIAAGLWEKSTRAITFDWEEYPNAIQVTQNFGKWLVCERGERSGSKWFRYADNVLIKLGAGISDSGKGTSTLSLQVYSGDFSRRYIVDSRYDTFGFGLEFGASGMNGRPAAVHNQMTATRIGDCPADMKPGEMRKIESSP